mmetsp:Transcript_1441/g.8855  ORF Transcript_1441/g.8855 Transcript_1441/m.8855 type:complete len:297 (-) Transcript_1441:40-930(-)
MREIRVQDVSHPLCIRHAYNFPGTQQVSSQFHARWKAPSCVPSKVHHQALRAILDDFAYGVSRAWIVLKRTNVHVSQGVSRTSHLFHRLQVHHRTHELQRLLLAPTAHQQHRFAPRFATQQISHVGERHVRHVASIHRQHRVARRHACPFGWSTTVGLHHDRFALLLRGQLHAHAGHGALAAGALHRFVALRLDHACERIAQGGQAAADRRVGVVSRGHACLLQRAVALLPPGRAELRRIHVSAVHGAPRLQIQQVLRRQGRNRSCQEPRSAPSARQHLPPPSWRRTAPLDVRHGT